MASLDKATGRVLLPPTVEPKSYDISIIPNFDTFTFSGTETITVEVVSATSEVHLHAKELYISAASFTGADGKAVEAVEVNMHLKNHVVVLKFLSELAVGAGKLSVTFAGDINGSMAGFYRSQYSDATGAKRWMGSTQFEALDARRAFPCWDEPSRKATFTLTLTVAKDSQALSNMPEASNSVQADGKVRKVTFLPTPVMSTYLLCWCVGEFDAVAALTKGGVLCRVFTPPGRGETGRFALDVAVKCLELYDEFFRVPYPLPKLDMIAIMDFAMGAMENWGLVTYREVDLLIDEAKASSQQRQRVASVVAHELAHQWFGNLVTMAWWDDLWLNEGFASWTQSFALDALFPSWGTWTQFVADDQATAMRLDALRTSHPIQVPIRRAEEVEEVFDAISYCKGASVVRMLHAVLGADAFQRGLQIYMERHQYGNTETFHLWRAWEEASGTSVAAIMEGWTTQMGFPLLEVTARSVDAATGSTTLTLKQSWFLADGSEADGRTWTVPVMAATPATPKGGHDAVRLCAGATFSVTVAGVAPPAAPGALSWVKLNAGQHVPCRVAYDAETLAGLAAAAGALALGAEDRAGLLLDAFALSKAGHAAMPPASLLQLAGAFKGEDDASVWEVLETVLRGVDKLLVAAGPTAPPGLRDKFVAFAAALIAPAAAASGWVPRVEDGHLGKLKRACLVRLAAHFSPTAPVVAAHCRALWDAFFAAPEGVADVIPSDFKLQVFKVVLANAPEGSTAEFDQLMAHLKLLTSNAERKDVYSAVGFAPSLALKAKVLDWAISGEIKLQDFFYPIGSVSGSGPEGLSLAWQFFRDNFNTIRGMTAKASASLMDAAIVSSMGGFATEARADEVAAFFTDSATGLPRLPQSNRKIQQALESIRANAKFLARILASDLSVLDA